MSGLRHRTAARLASCALAALTALTACEAPPRTLAWEPLPAIAPGTPYGLGVSALYAAEAGGALVAAGGANFPDIPAADGGAKRFYDTIWLLAPGADAWGAAGRLPSPAAYGATYALGDEVILAGGASADGSLDAVWALHPAKVRPQSEKQPEDRSGPTDRTDGVLVELLPRLPRPVEQAAAAREGATLYLAGGLSDGTPSTAVYACDADGDRSWRQIAELPEAMVQPVAAAHAGKLYVWGGFSPAEKRALDYGYRYDTASGRWERIGGLPDGGTLTGAAATALPSGLLLATGGVDRAIFTSALRLAPDQVSDYQRQPIEAYRFRRTVWLFDPATERWCLLGESPCTARAGAALVATGRGVALLGGELKPGIRTAENLRTSDLD